MCQTCQAMALKTVTPVSAIFSTSELLCKVPARAESSLPPRSQHAFFSSLPAIMGVQIEHISGGDGSTYPKTGQTVVVHYTGTLQNGSKFDSSRDRGVPFKFRIGKGEVIKGWDEGVAQLSIGQRARLICSPDYAYGARGHPGVIPPNSTLIFDVELLRVE